MKKSVIIIGAGPAGLTAGYELTKKSISVTILESNQTNVGGLAQTAEYKGYRFDIGGHRFFSKSDEINKLWDEMLPEGFMLVNRLSRIYYNKFFFDYPIRICNVLLSLGLLNSIKIFFSYIKIKLLPLKKEKTLEEWVVNRFGWQLYNHFFKTYTEKVWGVSCNKISADWAAQRIKGLSLKTAVINALSRKNNKLKTLIDEFKYPKYGPGMLWQNVANTIMKQGNKIALGQKVIKLKRNKQRIISVIAINYENKKIEYQGTQVISTMAIKDLITAIDPKVPDEILLAATNLKYRDFLTVILIVDTKYLFPDNWIYIHDPSVKVGRIQNFKNWSNYLIPDENKTCLGLEYFCFEGDELWNMNNTDLIELGKKEVSKIGLASYDKILEGNVIRMKKAYPVYDENYQENVKIIKNYLKVNISNLLLVGRNGMHKYNNQDHSMMTALLAARNILGENNDLWKVNSDAEYHEEIK